jgi:hypothetical protein
MTNEQFIELEVKEALEFSYNNGSVDSGLLDYYRINKSEDSRFTFQILVVIQNIGYVEGYIKYRKHYYRFDNEEDYQIMEIKRISDVVHWNW